MISKPRCLVLWGTALLGLTMVVPAAAADPARAGSRAYQVWRSTHDWSLKLPGGITGSTLASHKPAPVAGGQVVTTSEDDTNGDGTVDQRSIVTTNFDDKGRVVRHAEEYDAGADGTVEASQVITTEYDKFYDDLPERRARQRPADRVRSGPRGRRIGGRSRLHRRDV